MTNVQVTNQTIQVSGKDLYIRMVELDGTKGLTSTQVQEYLGIDKFMFLRTVGKLHLAGAKIATSHFQTLRGLSILPLKANNNKFWNLSQIEMMVKEVDTPQAWAIYKHMSEITKAVHKGEIGTAQELAGFSAEQQIAQLSAALAVAQAKLTNAQENAASFALTNCYKSHEVIRLYPEVIPLVRQYSEDNKRLGNEKWSLLSKSMHAMLTSMLKKLYGISTPIKWKTYSGDTSLFDKTEIDRLMTDLKISKIAA
ncbi:hypothetical protein EON65_50800 [archaeon]|nr:MAG: hypothetical protein EON65_50800 [archaeon]